VPEHLPTRSLLCQNLLKSADVIPEKIYVWVHSVTKLLISAWMMCCEMGFVCDCRTLSAVNIFNMSSTSDTVHSFMTKLLLVCDCASMWYVCVGWCSPSVICSTLSPVIHAPAHPATICVCVRACACVCLCLSWELLHLLHESSPLVTIWFLLNNSCDQYELFYQPKPSNLLCVTWNIYCCCWQ